jgi:hypothetical protein
MAARTSGRSGTADLALSKPTESYRVGIIRRKESNKVSVEKAKARLEEKKEDLAKTQRAHDETVDFLASREETLAKTSAELREAERQCKALPPVDDHEHKEGQALCASGLLSLQHWMDRVAASGGNPPEGTAEGCPKTWQAILGQVLGTFGPECLATSTHKFNVIVLSEEDENTKDAEMEAAQAAAAAALPAEPCTGNSGGSSC